MSGNIKEFNTYSVTSPIVKVGSSIDSRGRTLNITPEVARDIFDQLNDAAPLKDIHGDGEPIASMRKFILKEDGIYQKSIVNDVQRFESRYKDGHFYISPELEVEFDDVTGKVIGASLSSAAFTNNPGMIKEMPRIEQFYFEGPSNEQSNIGDTTTLESRTGTPNWTEPLGELKKTINTLNDTISTFGEHMSNSGNSNTNTEVEQPKSTESTGDTVTFSVDDLAKIVDQKVAERLAASNNPSPPIPEASETGSEKVTKPEASNNDELAEKYAQLMNELENVKGAQEKSDKKAFNAIVAELKAVGIEHPEKMLPDANLTTAQKTTILESIKENFAKNSPMSAPLQEPISSNGSSPKQKENVLNIDAILASESFESENDPQLRHKLLRLSDPELMRKYNMNVLFDTNGNYIGPV